MRKKNRALSDLGPQLLGRVQSKPDARNWNLSAFLGDAASLRDQAVAELKQTSVGYTYFKSHSMPASSHWAKALALLAQINGPAPSPTGDKIWADQEPILDQGQTPHCVGFDGAQWGNTLPVDDHYTNEDGHAIYYDCKVLDGQPKVENGTSVHSLARVLKNRGRLSAYAWAGDVTTISDWLRTKGPIMAGTDWHNNMFNPDSNGIIKLGGGIAGGHGYLLAGVETFGSALYYRIRNSWSANWGMKGEARILVSDFATLLSSNGEALAALELP